MELIRTAIGHDAYAMAVRVRSTKVSYIITYVFTKRTQLG